MATTSRPTKYIQISRQIDSSNNSPLMSQVSIYVVTFNCGRSLVDPDLLGPTLFDALPGRELPDILAINLQEVAPIGYAFLGGSHMRPYLDCVHASVKVAATTREDGVNSSENAYRLFAARTVGLTALMLFVKSEISDQIAWAQTAGVGVGLWDMGNKGAVAIRIGLKARHQKDEDVPLTFVSAHLAPFEGAIERRNQDWEAIVRNLVFTDDQGLTGKSRKSRPGSTSSSGEVEPLLTTAKRDASDLFEPGSYVFFAGDLNYRTSDTGPGAATHISFPRADATEGSPHHIDQWLQHDQLATERAAQRTLHGFDEEPIRFPPTYKYIHPKATTPAKAGSEPEVWNWAPHRFPSWCDRIMFLPSPALSLGTYTALPIQTTSDHRPVALAATLHPRKHTRHAPAAPFPRNPDWRAQRAAGRTKELVVGVMSYATLTREGNAIVFGGVVGVVSMWFLIAALLGPQLE